MELCMYVAQVHIPIYGHPLHEAISFYFNNKPTVEQSFKIN